VLTTIAIHSRIATALTVRDTRSNDGSAAVAAATCNDGNAFQPPSCSHGSRGSRSSSRPPVVGGGGQRTGKRRKHEKQVAMVAISASAPRRK
jgi:hypothetical protein